MDLKINYLPAHLIKPYEKNAKKHPIKQLEGIMQSIKQFGFKQPIVIDKNNVIVCGHGRYEAATTLGMESIPCIISNDLTDDQIKAYRILDNKLAESDYDDFILIDEINALPNFDFDIFNVDFPEINIEKEFFNDEDEEPKLDLSKNISEMGDIWLLGEHRVMCGDSTIVSQVEKLMNNQKANMVFTDPPYNTGMTSESQKGSGGLWKGNNNGSTRLSHMFNDSYTPEEWQKFMASFMASYWMLMKDDSVAYICLDWRRNHELIMHIENSGFHRSNLIVWDKMVHGLGSDYKYTHEFINVCKKGKPVLNTHQGDKEYSDVWHIQRKMGKDDDHATKKPVEIIERCIRHASKKNDLVVDLFGGSGSTLIASEKLNRKCYMSEIEPNYVDIIIKRWEKFTGKDAILESTNKTFKEISNGKSMEIN